MGFPRSGARWKTRFGSWVGEVTVAQIVSHLQRDPELRVTESAVYHWLRGHAPNPDRARALVELSKGEISYDAIYSHRKELREAEKCSRSRSRSTR